MKKLTTFLAVATCAIGVGAGSAAARTTPVTVAMHDPGCHWFLSGGKFLKKLSVTGPVSLLNVDEATLKVTGAQGLQLDRVGKKLELGRGVYHITMVGQAPDDNHLVLTVK